MKYESMVYMYDWIMEKHQLISFSQAEFAEDNIVHRSIDLNSRMISFEEKGTDVESQGSNRRRSRFNNRLYTVLGRPEDQVLTAVDRPVDRPNTEGYIIANGRPSDRPAKQQRVGLYSRSTPDQPI